MRIGKKVLLFCFAALLFTFAGTGRQAMAKTMQATDTNGKITFTVEYPDDVKCGQEVTFKMSMTGGNGNYEYRLKNLLVYDGSEYVQVYDVSYGTNTVYTSDTEYKFTFYASGTYYIAFDAMDKHYDENGKVDGSTFVTTGTYSNPIVINDSNYPSVEQRVETIAAQCKAQCSTDYEKALWLHDWLINNADYDYSYSYCSAEGVLARGKGTCESYHRAYVMLLNKVGIQTGRMAGNGHCWTAVRMDGKWYQVDVTWDDMGASYSGTDYEHMYFGLNDSIMGLVHSDHTGAVAGYASNSLENNYFIKTGKVTQWSDAYAALVAQKLADGETEFELPVSAPQAYKNVIYNLVAYQLSTQQWDGVGITATYANNVITCKKVVAGSTGGTSSGGSTGGTSSGGSTGGTSSGGSTGGSSSGGSTGGSSSGGSTGGSSGGSSGGASGGASGGSAGGASSVAAVTSVNGSLSVDLTTGEGGFVARLYSTVMNRPASEAEVSLWANLINSGASVADVAYVFVFSPESQSKGYDNSDYVEQLYVSLMGRNSDVQGKLTWVNALNQGATREYVFQQFVNSDEFKLLCGMYGVGQNNAAVVTGVSGDNISSFVARNYSQFLGRSYDVDGLNNWSSAIATGAQTMQQVAYGFVFSPECQNMNLSNEGYVAMLYRGCFDREGDSDGMAGWIGALDSGTMSREDVFWGFANSQEFIDMTRRYGL